MLGLTEQKVPSFWPLQCGGWILLYLLSLAASSPHLHEAFIFAYNTWDIVVLFVATLALRPMLRLVGTRWRGSWLRLQCTIFGTCLLAGSLSTYLICLITFGARGFRLSYWTLSGVQCSLILFLWSALYLNVRHWTALHQHQPLRATGEIGQPELTHAPQPAAVYATSFTVRTGNRLEIVPVDRVLWIAASKDYVELHTGSSTHLLRETMTSILKRLDPSLFMRVHRSRIVRTEQIRDLSPLENGEYRIRLHDGSEHRSSRTYSREIGAWVRGGEATPARQQHG